VTLILVDHETGCVGNFISLAFNEYEELRGRTRHVREFKDKVVLNFKLDLNSDSVILNWIRSPLWCPHLLGSPTPS
jgi:hypothetical protein